LVTTLIGNHSLGKFRLRFTWSLDGFRHNSQNFQKNQLKVSSICVEKMNKDYLLGSFIYLGTYICEKGTKGEKNIGRVCKVGNV